MNLLPSFVLSGILHQLWRLSSTLPLQPNSTQETYQHRLILSSIYLFCHLCTHVSAQCKHNKSVFDSHSCSSKQKWSCCNSILYSLDKYRKCTVLYTCDKHCIWKTYFPSSGCVGVHTDSTSWTKRAMIQALESQPEDGKYNLVTLSSTWVSFKAVRSFNTNHPFS